MAAPNITITRNGDGAGAPTVAANGTMVSSSRPLTAVRLGPLTCFCACTPSRAAAASMVDGHTEFFPAEEVFDPVYSSSTKTRMAELEEDRALSSMQVPWNDQQQAAKAVAMAQAAAKSAGVGTNLKSVAAPVSFAPTGPAERPAVKLASSNLTQSSLNEQKSVKLPTQKVGLQKVQPVEDTPCGRVKTTRFEPPEVKSVSLNLASSGAATAKLAAPASSGQALSVAPMQSRSKFGAAVRGLTLIALLSATGFGAFSVVTLKNNVPETLAKMTDSTCHIASEVAASPHPTEIPYTVQDIADKGSSRLHLNWMTVTCSVRLQESWGSSLPQANGVTGLTIAYPENWSRLSLPPLSCDTEVRRLKQLSGGFPCSSPVGNFEGLGVTAMPKAELAKHKWFLAVLEFSRTGSPYLCSAMGFCLLVTWLVVALYGCLTKPCRKKAAARECLEDDEPALPAPYRPLAGC